MRRRCAGKARKLNTEVVQGTENALAALLQDMGVNHRCGKIVVSEQLLNGADVGAALEQVCGKGMTKSVGTDLLCQAGAADGHLDGFVDDAGINMMAASDIGTRIYGEVSGGENVLPNPLLWGIWILPIQRMRQVNTTMPQS